MLTEYRTNQLTLLLALVAMVPLNACRKEKSEPPTAVVLASLEETKETAEAARKSLQELKPGFAALNDQLAGLHREYDPLPPGLPGFGDTRSRFYSMSVALGALSAKPAWLEGRIEAAAKSRDRAELQAILEEILETKNQIRAAEARAAQLLQEVQPFKDQAAIRIEARQGTGKTTCE